MEEETKQAILRLEQNNNDLKEKFDELFKSIQQVKTEMEKRKVLEEWQNFVENKYRYVSVDDLEWYEFNEEPKGSYGDK